MEVLSIAIITLVTGVVAGGVLARVFTPNVAIYGSLVLFGLAAVLLLIGSQKQGQDALGYSIPALMLCVPTGVGMGLVGLLAKYGGRR